MRSGVRGAKERAPSRESARLSRAPGGFALGGAATRVPFVALAAAILALTFLAYLPALRAGYAWDDDGFLTDNPLIHAADGPARFWASTEPPDYYPLTSTMLWVEWRLWRGDARGFHAVNVLLHALAAILLWRVLARLCVPGAAFAAFAFAVHPVCVESVAWITERKNVLPMVFGLLSLLAYLRFEEEGRKRTYAWALIAFLLGLLAKTSLVTLPCVLLGLAWWRRGRISKRDLLRSAPFFALSLALGAVTAWYQSQVAIGAEVVRSDGFVSRLAVAGRALWFYLGKALFPVHLCFVYPRWTIDPSAWVAWLPLAALAACFAFFLVHRRSWTRCALFALGSYVALLLPVLGFLDIYFMRFSLVADHWQYFALPVAITSVVSAAAWGWERAWPERRTAGVCVAGLVVAALAALSWRGAREYRDRETLFRSILACNPACWMAHNNLGNELQARGRSEEAIEHYRSALDLKPDYAEAQNNWGNALEQLGRSDEAIEHYRASLAIDARQALAHNGLGTALEHQGRIEEALAQYEAAVRVDADYATAHNNVGNALRALGRPQEALAEFESALRLRPDFAEARNNLGVALKSLGRREEALEQFEAALRLQPEYAGAHYNLANVLQALGRPEEAIPHYRATLQLQPEHASAHNNLGVALQALGRSEEARAQFEAAVRIDPGFAEARQNLERMLGR